jgi:secondary thiamine-phosphate synthase enzyme
MLLPGTGRSARQAPGSSMLRQAQGELVLATDGQGLVMITGEVAAWLSRQGMRTGLLTLFCTHSSASLLIQENAAPEVRGDLLRFFRRLVPEQASLYEHDEEGPDDMPAHIRAALTNTSLAVPVRDGRLALGTWQGIYLFEHRAAPHRRTVLLHLIGE